MPLGIARDRNYALQPAMVDPVDAGSDYGPGTQSKEGGGDMGLRGFGGRPGDPPQRYLKEPDTLSTNRVFAPIDLLCVRHLQHQSSRPEISSGAAITVLPRPFA